MHDITVWTRVLRPDGSLMWADCMEWHGVDDEVRAWLAESCRITALDLVGYPETTGPGYTIQYRTLVQGPSPSDTTMLDFGRVDYAGVLRFQRWALHELAEMLVLFEAKHDQEAAKPTRRRSAWRTVLGVLWQRMRAAA